MNPQSLGLTVLTGMIAPAVLISACGPLLLSTTIRFGRIVDRIRVLSDRLEALLHGKVEEPHADDKIKLWFDQLERLSQRARMLQRGMMTFYLALASFIGSSVVIGLEAFFGFHVEWIPVMIGIFGTLCLLYGSLLLIRESSMGLESVNRELEFIRRTGHRSIEQRET